jgi:hypothetical protein
MDSTDIIANNKAAEKLRIIEQLNNMPIVEIACKRAGVARATYYRCSRYTKEKLRCTGKSMSISRVHRQMVVLANGGQLKRSHLSKKLNEAVDEHYSVTKAVMARKDSNFSSNTRLRDYVNYLFTAGTEKDRALFFTNLECKLVVLDGKVVI